MAIQKNRQTVSRPSGSGSSALLPSSELITDLTLEDSDFEVPSAEKQQSICLIFGDDGAGKTTFATMFAPDPVALINFDSRSGPAVHKAIAEGRKILPAGIDFPARITKLSDVQARMYGQRAVDKTIKNLEIAVRESEKGNIRTICLDTGTEFSEILSVAVTGSTANTKGDYGKSKNIINQQWWDIFKLARKGEAHLIVLARSKPIWINNEPTGRMEHRGPEVMSSGVDWAGWIRLRPGRKGRKTQEFELEITKSGIDISELGEVYNQNEWEEMGGPFAYACFRQYGWMVDGTG